MRSYLIVDDNRALAENLAEIVQETGARATLAGGGAEALQLARGQHFDVLVTDMRMPEVNGADLVRELRGVDPGLPVIVITAFTSDDQLGLARRYGLLGVLPKPVPIGRLFELSAVARRDGVVAIVEDDPALADNLSEALSAKGFPTVVATSLTDAERIGASPFAAIADLRLPDGPDGRSVALLRERFPGLPLIAVTAHDELARPDETSGFFAKPYRMEEILALVEELHARRHTAKPGA